MIHPNAAIGGGVLPSRENTAQRRNDSALPPAVNSRADRSDIGMLALLAGEEAIRFSADASKVASKSANTFAGRPYLTPPKHDAQSAQRHQNDLLAFQTLLETFSDDARAYGMRSANILAEQSRTITRNALDRSEEKSKVAAERQARADKMSGIFSWIGKIVAAIITVVSVVAAIFTGGASLVLAGAAIAYLVIDKGVEMATGKSLTGRAMAALAGPLGALQKKLIEAMKGALGEETAAVMAGVIIGTVVAVITVAAVILARTAATAVIKALPTSKLLTTITTKATALLGRSVANSMNRAELIAQFGSAGFGSVQSGGKVVIAHHERIAADSEAEMQILQTTTRLTSEAERQLWNAAQALEETLKELAEAVSKHLKIHLDSALVVAQAGRRAA